MSACASAYRREVNTFADIGDEGEVWFGEDSVDRMVRYLVDLLADTRDAPHVLDLGMGNGHLLFAIAEDEDLQEVFEPQRMLGVDYSEPSVALAKAVGKARGGPCTDIRFEVADLCDAACVDALAQSCEPAGWDIVCDKGTVRLYIYICADSLMPWHCRRSQLTGSAR